jgi:DNA-binding NarL/FixJ family response regulator
LSDIAPVRVVVVDDYEPWRRFVSTTLQEQPELRILGEAADGLEAVQLAQQLQPDLILLDIGLPKLNGLEAARRIREVSPQSKILFLSENRSRDIAQAALATGPAGYVVKSSAASELLSAVAAVLQGKHFLSASVTGPALADTQNKHTDPLRRENMELHEVRFHTSDAAFVDDFAYFLEPALKIGNAVIVIATESHRADILRRLEADGLDIATAAQQRYIPLDVADSVSTFVDRGSRELVPLTKDTRDPLHQAVMVATQKGLHVAVG